MDEFDNNSKEEEQPQKEKKSSSKKIVSIFIGLDILLVIIIVLLLCLKSCKNTQEEPNNTEPEIDMVRVNKITDVFKKIAKDNIQYAGFDDDPLDKVMAITYEDNYPNKFSMNISVTSETKVYYCIVEDYPYDGDKEQYNDFISYLLLDTTEYKPTNGHSELHPYTKTDTRVNTSKSVNKYVIGETSSEPKDNYLYGFYRDLDNKDFYIYQDQLIEENVDPFSKNSDQIIKSDSLLYDYYRALLIA